MAESGRSDVTDRAPTEAAHLAEVLECEFCELHGSDFQEKMFPSLREDGKPKTLWDKIHSLPGDGRTALCLSGGGVRSAAFNLGVLQGLARLGLLEPLSLSLDCLRRWLHRMLVERLASPLPARNCRTYT